MPLSLDLIGVYEPDPPIRLYGVSFSPDGSLLAFGGSDGSLFFGTSYDLRSICRIDAHKGICRATLFSDDGSALISVGDGGLRLWNPTLPGPEPITSNLSIGTRAIVSFHQNKLLIGDISGSMYICDIRALRRNVRLPFSDALRRISRPREIPSLWGCGVWQLCRTPIAGVVAAARDRDGIQLIDARRRVILSSHNPHGEVYAADVQLMSGRLVATGFDGRASIFLVRGTRLEPVTILQSPLDLGRTVSMAHFADRFAVGGWGGFALYDGLSGNWLVPRPLYPNNVISVRFHPTDDSVLAVAGRDAGLWLWKLKA